MTAAPTTAPSAGSLTPEPADPGPADPSTRGRLTLAERVVEKIAAAAAVEVPGATGLTRQLAGRTLGSPHARATARVDGAITSLTLEIGIDYPSPVRQVSRQVRHHVTDQVQRLCGLRVDHIDLTVAALRRPEQSRSRVQ